MNPGLSVALGVALISLLPFVFVLGTAFVKISTVLHIARSALGTQSIPSNLVVLALSGALTVVAMAPVGTKIGDRLAPQLTDAALADTLALVDGVVTAAKEPMRAFLTANASDDEKSRFLDLAKTTHPPDQRHRVTGDDLVVVAPAFVVTELMEAFALGFAIFIPFLVIELVVANVLLALGMQMMNPSQVSLPFKLLLFVAADGWGLLSQALITGYVHG